MIEAPNRFNRQRSHQTGSRSELIRRLETGTSARSWIIRGVAPIALPPLPLQNNDRKKEKKFCQSFCVLLLLGTARSGDAKGLNKGVPTAEERRKPGEKIRREQRSAWFKNISRFVAPARTTSRMSSFGCPNAKSPFLPACRVRGSHRWSLIPLPTKHNDCCL